MCSYKSKVEKHIEQNFHSVAGVMPQGWDLGVLGQLGGSKTLVGNFLENGQNKPHGLLPDPTSMLLN